MHYSVGIRAVCYHMFHHLTNVLDTIQMTQAQISNTKDTIISILTWIVMILKSMTIRVQIWQIYHSSFTI